MATEDPQDRADQLARDAWLSVVRIFRSQGALDAGVRAAEAEGLPMRLYWVLLSLPLEPGEAKSMGQLAQDCFSTPSYMTVVIDGLEERGLAQRQTDPDDRRVKLVSLTEEGRAVVERSHERMSRPPSGIAALTPAELTTLRDLLAKAAEPYPW